MLEFSFPAKPYFIITGEFCCFYCCCLPLNLRSVWRVYCCLRVYIPWEERERERSSKHGEECKKQIAAANNTNTCSTICILCTMTIYSVMHLCTPPTNRNTHTHTHPHAHTLDLGASAVLVSRFIVTVKFSFRLNWIIPNIMDVCLCFIRAYLYVCVCVKFCTN